MSLHMNRPKYFSIVDLKKDIKRVCSLHEALYALILMRRHMWLYAEFQSLFNSEVQHRQAMESLSRTILMFDYIMYAVAKKFWKLMRLEAPSK